MHSLATNLCVQNVPSKMDIMFIKNKKRIKWKLEKSLKNKDYIRHETVQTKT